MFRDRQQILRRPWGVPWQVRPPLARKPQAERSSTDTWNRGGTRSLRTRWPDPGQMDFVATGTRKAKRRENIVILQHDDCPLNPRSTQPKTGNHHIRLPTLSIGDPIIMVARRTVTSGRSKKLGHICASRDRQACPQSQIRVRSARRVTDAASARVWKEGQVTTAGETTFR
jgi:hypothetical protein